MHALHTVNKHSDGERFLTYIRRGSCRTSAMNSDAIPRVGPLSRERGGRCAETGKSLSGAGLQVALALFPNLTIAVSSLYSRRTPLTCRRNPALTPGT